MRRSGCRLTRADVEHLRRLVRKLRHPAGCWGRAVREIETLLAGAEVIDDRSAAGDLVTINSALRLRNLDCGAEATYVLVDPSEAGHVENGLSILFPLGLAVLGRRAGEIFLYRGLSGPTRVKVEQVERCATPGNCCLALAPA